MYVCRPRKLDVNISCSDIFLLYEKHASKGILSPIQGLFIFILFVPVSKQVSEHLVAMHHVLVKD